MTSTSPTAIEFVRQGVRMRIRYEPRHDGVGWWRYEERYVHGERKKTGREVVRDVDVSTTAEALL